MALVKGSTQSGTGSTMTTYPSSHRRHHPRTLINFLERKVVQRRWAQLQCAPSPLPGWQCLLHHGLGRGQSCHLRRDLQRRRPLAVPMKRNLFGTSERRPQRNRRHLLGLNSTSQERTPEELLRRLRILQYSDLLFLKVNVLQWTSTLQIHKTSTTTGPRSCRHSPHGHVPFSIAPEGASKTLCAGYVRKIRKTTMRALCATTVRQLCADTWGCPETHECVKDSDDGRPRVRQLCAEHKKTKVRQLCPVTPILMARSKLCHNK